MGLGLAALLLLSAATARRVEVDERGSIVDLPTTNGESNTNTQKNSKKPPPDMPKRKRLACKDKWQNCKQKATLNLSACALDLDMLTQCPNTCGTCQFQELVRDATKCDDTHEKCKLWAQDGECKNNPRFMLNSCSNSCGTCEAKKSGCVRKNTHPAVTMPDGLNDTLARVFIDFPQFEPKALSTDPWVIQFENIVDEAEAHAMVNACPIYERSLAGDQVSKVRTSTQCWCDQSNGCEQTEIFRNVTNRILEITRLPYNYAEYFQVLKYEPGQFYKSHHDQQSGHWTPQGVRLYTFFIYLSNVEEGGGTNFPQLNITVTPKLGRAVLWPSVYSNDLTVSDLRTTHEALPVIKGAKHAANLWQHLYDFKTPSKEGLCVFLGRNSNHD